LEQIVKSSFTGIDGNKFTTSKETSLALRGNCKDFKSFTRCKEFLMEYFDLKFMSSGITELRSLQILLAGAVKHEKIGRIGRFILCNLGRL
jgi:hypothetical protein